ncbi:MAG: hypothetical protein ACK4N5_24725 [Myxococcales bacterium]
MSASRLSRRALFGLRRQTPSATRSFSLEDFYARRRRDGLVGESPGARGLRPGLSTDVPTSDVGVPDLPGKR